MRGRDAARVGVVVAALMAPGSPSPASAQEDFRAADVDRPIHVEDANPLKFREWEVELGTRGSMREHMSALIGVFELKAGLFRNAQVGFEMEAGLEGEGPGDGAGDGDRGTATGIEAFEAHVLYQLARETPALPAFAVRLDVGTPGVGDIGHDDFSAAVKGVATRSFGRLRIHGNGGYGVMSDADGDDFWKLGLGFDYPIGLFSKAILGDVYAEVPVSSGRSRVWVELGTRWQVSNWTVFDLGLATRLDQWDAGNANVEVIVGVSRVFGWSGLTRVPPYPHPSIR